MKPLISIIVPIYNVEKELIRCLNSIRTQKYKNLEIILIDNASSDNSGVICDRYALIDSRIKVLHLDKLGVSYARNEGLRIASGEYISFIDSDDWIEEDYYEKFISEMQDCSIAITGYKLLDESGMIIDKLELSENMFTLKQNNFYNIETLVKNSSFGLVWNKLFKRELVKEVKFPPLKSREDLIFNLSLLKPNLNIKIIGNYTGYNWVQRAHSATHKADARNVYILKEIGDCIFNLDWKFNKQSKITVYNYVMKVFLADLFLKDIVGNVNLNGNEKKGYFRELCSKPYRDYYKNLHIFSSDNKYIKIMVACLKTNQWRLLLKVTESIKTLGQLNK